MKPSQKTTYESSQRGEISVTLSISSLVKLASLLWYDARALGHEAFNPSHRKTCCGSQRPCRPGEPKELCGTFLVFARDLCSVGCAADQH